MRKPGPIGDRSSSRRGRKSDLLAAGMVRLKAPKLQSLVLRMQTRYDQIKVRYDQIRARNRRLEVNNQTLLANHEQEVIAQRDLEASLSRYADLYDFAPGGYVCLDRSEEHTSELQSRV